MIPGPTTRGTVRALGLRANLAQFLLLVAVNAFVGAMVGLERTVLPLLAGDAFGVASRTATLSFILAFGLVKAPFNLVAGRLADRHGRKPVLLAGWIAGLAVPWLIIAAPSWSWIVAANMLLGLNQGLAWSATVIMKVDLVGPRRRGLAMGINEFAGYLAVGLAAFASGEIAAAFGLRPAPFYVGVGVAACGLALSALFVRETAGFVELETPDGDGPPDAGPGLRGVLARAGWSDRTLSTCSHAGLVNNLNDALAWGIFPLFFTLAGLSVAQVGLLVAIYPVTWGLAQLGTGALSDRTGRKPLITAGMLMQGVALIAIPFVASMAAWSATLVLLGIGTAFVYPTLLAAVADASHPAWRGSALGAYRLWRDGGYVVGALAAGAVADATSLGAAILAVGALTLATGAWVQIRLAETAGP